MPHLGEDDSKLHGKEILEDSIKGETRQERFRRIKAKELERIQQEIKEEEREEEEEREHVKETAEEKDARLKALEEHKKNSSYVPRSRKKVN
jgi:hypothetical protein